MEANGPQGAGPPEAVLARWEQVQADVEATAREYREAGWRVVAVTPGDVTPLPVEADSDRYGLDVLVPDDDLDAVERIAGEAAFDTTEVYRNYADGHVFALVVLESAGAEAAVLYPVYYDLETARTTLERATRRGRMRTHLRDLADERTITFEHDDPELFVPAPGSED